MQFFSESVYLVLFCFSETGSFTGLQLATLAKPAGQSCTDPPVSASPALVESALVQCWRHEVHSSTPGFVMWIPGIRFRFQRLQSKRFPEMLPRALMPFSCSQRKTRELKRSEPVSVSRSTGHKAWLPLQCSSL